MEEIPASGRSPWRRKWRPTPVFLPGKSHGQRSLAGNSPGVMKSQTRLSRWKKERIKGWRERGRRQVTDRCLAILAPGFHPRHMQMKPLLLFWFSTKCLEPMWHSGCIDIWARRVKCVWSQTLGTCRNSLGLLRSPWIMSRYKFSFTVLWANH